MLFKTIFTQFILLNILNEKEDKKGPDEEIKLKEADQLCRRILHLAQKSNWESINEPLKVKIKATFS